MTAAFLAFSWTSDRIAAAAAGLALLVFLYIFFFGKKRLPAQPPPMGPQEITIVVAGGYKPDTIVAKKGMPLKLVFDRRETNPCSDEVVLPEFGIRQALPPHSKTAIEVTSGFSPGRPSPSVCHWDPSQLAML